MRDHTDFSQFYHTKCNFPKKSLDTSIPQFFSPNVAEIPNLGTNSPKVGSLCYSYETRHTVYYITVRSRTSSSSTNENQVYLCVPTEQRWRASLWSAIPRCTKEYTWPANWWPIFVYFLEYWLKNVLLYLANSMQNQTRSTKWHSQWRSWGGRSTPGGTFIGAALCAML